MAFLSGPFFSTFSISRYRVELVSGVPTGRAFLFWCPRAFLGSGVRVSARTSGWASISKSAVQAAQTFCLLNIRFSVLLLVEENVGDFGLLSIILSFSVCFFQFFSFLLFRCLIQRRSL